MSTEKKPNKAQQLLASLKKLLFEEMPAEPPKVYKTTDGTEISCDKLEAGGTAMIGGMAAPEGTYTLEDGTVLMVGANGMITSVTPAAPAVPAAAATPPAVPTPPPVPVAASADIPEELKTLEGIKKKYDSFATGTPEERIANLELVAKALIEYNFGYELRQAQEAKDRAAALKIYTDNLKAMEDQVTSQMATMKEMYALMEQIVGLPTEEPPEQKKKFSFSNMEAKNESLKKYQEAARKLGEKNKKPETTN